MEQRREWVTEIPLGARPGGGALFKFQGEVFLLENRFLTWTGAMRLGWWMSWVHPWGVEEKETLIY